MPETLRFQGPELARSLKTALADWIAGRLPDLTFTAAERLDLGESLYRLVVHVAGEPQDEEYVTDLGAVGEWAIEAARDGLDRHFRRLARTLGMAGDPHVRWVEAPRPDAPAAGSPGAGPGPTAPVSLGGWRERLDVRHATAAEVAALPGVGRALAARIIAFRETGGLGRVDDLTRVSGLGAKTLGVLRPLVYLSASEGAAILSNPALDHFRRRPGPVSYVDLLRATGGTFRSAAPPAQGGPGTGEAEASLRSSVVREVSRAAAAAAVSPPPGGAGRPVPAEAAAHLGRLIRRGRELTEAAQPLPEADWCGLVNGSAYGDLVVRLIEGAREEIIVVMFFMVYVPGREHPANALVESLVAARRRGVRVSVTLDLDRPEDVFGSRIVNREAFRYLRDNGVDVAWDRPERLTHTKLLIVDGREVLAGSHNWTAGSLHAYDDKSLVLRSPAVAEGLRGTAREIREN